MACSFILVFASNSIHRSVKNILAKFEYFVNILVETLSHYEIAIWTTCNGWTNTSANTSRVAICTIKVLEFLFRAVLAISLLSMSSTQKVVGKASIII